MTSEPKSAPAATPAVFPSPVFPSVPSVHVAETFLSIQGEGVWTGTPMFFIRLAGCNVGRYLGQCREVLAASPKDQALFSYYPYRHSICTTYSGESFICDTDYHRSSKFSTEDLIEKIPKGVKHVCITGGEPFLQHPLNGLMHGLINKDFRIHIETSGTILIPNAIDDVVIRYLCRGSESVWITCSPKQGYLLENQTYIDEFKFLVGPDFQITPELDLLAAHMPVYLQPINGINEPDEASVQRVVDLALKNPHFRLSAQLHKYLRLR